MDIRTIDAVIRKQPSRWGVALDRIKAYSNQEIIHPKFIPGCAAFLEYLEIALTLMFPNHFDKLNLDLEDLADRFIKIQVTATTSKENATLEQSKLLVSLIAKFLTDLGLDDLPDPEATLEAQIYISYIKKQLLDRQPEPPSLETYRSMLGIEEAYDSMNDALDTILDDPWEDTAEIKHKASVHKDVASDESMFDVSKCNLTNAQFKGPFAETVKGDQVGDVINNVIVNNPTAKMVEDPKKWSQATHGSFTAKDTTAPITQPEIQKIDRLGSDFPYSVEVNHILYLDGLMVEEYLKGSTWDNWFCSTIGLSPDYMDYWSNGFEVSFANRAVRDFVFTQLSKVYFG